MACSKSFLIFCIVVVAAVEAAKFPKEWKACKQDSKMNECLKDAVSKVIPFFVQGIPNLGVHTIDPLHFNQISIGKGTGPVSLDLDFIDLDVKGIKNAIIESMDTDWKKMKLGVKIPKLNLDGKYKIDGKVLILPITGTGDCQLELHNFKAQLNFDIGEKTVGNKKYYNIDKLDFSFDTDQFKLHLENLFNGDKALGDQMNIFINENWREILNELKPAITKSFSIAASEIGNRVFSKIPKDLITPP